MGHYGSGKTFVAVNYALALSKKGLPVSIYDLDIVNPYFRTIDGTQIVECGAYKLKHVMRYNNVEAMINANNDYSSFTGEAGNGLWKVNETETGRELVWVGRASA